MSHGVERAETKTSAAEEPRFRTAEKSFKRIRQLQSAALSQGNRKAKRTFKSQKTQESIQSLFARTIDFDVPTKRTGKTQVLRQKINHVDEFPNAEVYCLSGVKGFFYIRNALTLKEQYFWAERALSVYSRAHHTNLTNLHGPQPDMWKQCVQTGQLDSFSKLRWSSLGYHYDWTARTYDQENKTPFPADLRDLTQRLARLVGEDVVGEAGIVNYYPISSNMGGHVDDAELIQTKPIVSISLGCTCVFLLGGRTKGEEPVSMFLRSGDVVIMGGDSRMCFHAVPCILADTFPARQPLFQPCVEGTDSDGTYLWTPSLENTDGDGDSDGDSTNDRADLRLVHKYLQKNRLNINVRQVEGDQPQERFAPGANSRGQSKPPSCEVNHNK